MKNLDEKLKLMKQLHDAGLKGGLWFHTDHSGYWQIMSGFSRTGQQWFPLEQVLGLLEDIGWIQFKGNDIEVGISLKLIEWEEIVVSLPKRVENDYHLAALKLLVQVLEKYPNEVKR